MALGVQSPKPRSEAMKSHPQRSCVAQMLQGARGWRGPGVGHLLLTVRQEPRGEGRTRPCSLSDSRRNRPGGGDRGAQGQPGRSQLNRDHKTKPNQIQLPLTEACHTPGTVLYAVFGRAISVLGTSLGGRHDYHDLHFIHVEAKVQNSKVPYKGHIVKIPR